MSIEQDVSIVLRIINVFSLGVVAIIYSVLFNPTYSIYKLQKIMITALVVCIVSDALIPYSYGYRHGLIEF
jgi:hypothetical protein